MWESGNGSTRSHSRSPRPGAGSRSSAPRRRPTGHSRTPRKRVASGSLHEIRLVPLPGVPEIGPGDDLASLLGDALERAGGLEGGDVLVIAHKVVSKAEGRTERADDELEVVVREARAIRRRRGDLVIAETEQGFVCASAGVDHSNAPGEGELVLLPQDPDASAARLRDELARRFGLAPAVIVSDSFGRPWRQGTTDVAIGVAGLSPLLDLRGTRDAAGRELRSTVIAVADELAGAAELVMGKTDGIPAVLVRGYEAPPGDGSAREIVMPRDRDLFP
jgi:coenzyme F420-0:L-glutamate ligase / coenzyme F420-1:gamma-L-glutamate ligase